VGKRFPKPPKNACHKLKLFSLFFAKRGVVPRLDISPACKSAGERLRKSLWLMPRGLKDVCPATYLPECLPQDVSLTRCSPLRWFAVILSPREYAWRTTRPGDCSPNTRPGSGRIFGGVPPTTNSFGGILETRAWLGHNNFRIVAMVLQCVGVESRRNLVVRGLFITSRVYVELALPLATSLHQPKIQ